MLFSDLEQHTHNGIDSPLIDKAANNITPGLSPLATATLSSDTAELSLSFPAKSLLRVFIYCGFDATSYLGLQFNGDTGAHYGNAIYRGSSTSVNASASDSTDMRVSGDSSLPRFIVLDIYNLTAVRKLVNGQGVIYASNSSAPSNIESIGGVWNNTSSQISSIKIFPTGSSGTVLSAGTSIEVWG